MVVKKGLSHFLRICIILFISFLTYEYQKNVEFLADFKSVEIIGKKCTQKKVFAKNFCKLVV
jgi:hypothetical protein